MGENLVIVESPAKAKTIEKFLGKGFEVMSSYGHIRDLSKKDLGIDIQQNFKPLYIVPDDKKKVVTDLKKAVKSASTVWLASDEDREGEAIAWHLSEVLELSKEKTKRIVFHEITKEAITRAIEAPRALDTHLVNAQQARRVLDRLVGFEISPILWKKVKPSLSAGRVQSVAVRLLVEREREIMAFRPVKSFKVSALFTFIDEKGHQSQLKAQLADKLDTIDEANTFLDHCKNALFTITDINTRPGKKSPAPPFTTSTLQQEASRKLGFSVSQTMTIAQRLYEAGKITYMRTDSVNLSNTALTAAESIIRKEFGDKYFFQRQYKTKSKGAQEAHEAIRPTYLDKPEISGNSTEQKLYELIWKRTIASQMADAQLEKTTIKIDVSGNPNQFVSNGEVLKFDGFLKVYIESTDDEQEESASELLPPVSLNQRLQYKSIEATERYTYHPPRYTEASLVKKLEELGIGRPSTYAPTISTIQQRGYVVKEDREGSIRNYHVLTLQGGKIYDAVKQEITGAEKSKLFPNDIGMVVNDFLVDNFNNILDFNFTAKVEKEFDDIASGGLEWTEMLKGFYKKFHGQVETTLEKAEKSVGERLLGNDPVTGKPVYVKIGRFGPMVQIGDASDEQEKPKFAGLQKGQYLETITLDEALGLFDLPRIIGEFEGKTVTIGIGRFGPYVKHDNKFISLKKTDDPYKIILDRAIELIAEKREKEKNKVIRKFDEDQTLQILNGRWGPYISQGKENYRIPKGTDAASLDYAGCLKIIKESRIKPKTKPKK